MSRVEEAPERLEKVERWIRELEDGLRRLPQ
jgi:hypothetical protein